MEREYRGNLMLQANLVKQHYTDANLDHDKQKLEASIFSCVICCLVAGFMLYALLSIYNKPGGISSSEFFKIPIIMLFPSIAVYDVLSTTWKRYKTIKNKTSNLDSLLTDVKPPVLTVTDTYISYDFTDLGSYDNKHVILSMNINDVSSVSFSEAENCYYIYGAGKNYEPKGLVGKRINITKMQIPNIFSVDICDLLHEATGGRV